MIILKPLVIDATGWLEANWVDRFRNADIEVSATDTEPAKIVPGTYVELPVRSGSYHPTQLNMLQAAAVEMGTPLDEYETMLTDWVASYVPPQPTPEPTQFEKDQTRYEKRAAVKDQLIAYIAADNMSRVRSGTWTVADLTALMTDPALAAVNAYMSTLSFELAAQSILGAQTPLLTEEIRNDWVSKLMQHYYLEG